MCFSAEASLGAAIVLLPAGAYCIEAASRKDRRYLPFAVVPIFFGIQQLCEALVWLGLDRGNAGMTDAAARAYLFFALALWPIWIPLAAAAIEPRVRKRWLLAALGALGLLYGIVHYLPFAAGLSPDPEAVGHSIHYDLPALPAIRSFGTWGWMALYLTTVSVPLLASGNRSLRPLGAGLIVFALISVLLFEHAFASVWCFFAAFLSGGLAIVLRRIPGESREQHEPSLRPMPSN